MLSLQKLLSKRFGPIPSEITAKISTANLDDIERWFDRAIDAVNFRIFLIRTMIRNHDRSYAHWFCRVCLNAHQWSSRPAKAA